ESSSDLAVVADLLNGDIELQGLAVDTDLGWELLIALVSGGLAGEDEIAARLAEDHTATGQQSAAHARAAIPTVEGKQAAWSSLVDTATAPNTIVHVTTLGFLRVADPRILQPFVDQYFEMLTDVWNTRSYA